MSEINEVERHRDPVDQITQRNLRRLRRLDAVAVLVASREPDGLLVGIRFVDGPTDARTVLAVADALDDHARALRRKVAAMIDDHLGATP